MVKAQSQRQAILEGMVRVAGRKGYREATVSDIIAASGVARSTFYKHFANRHECFLGAYDIAAERVLAAIETSCDRQCAWIERACGGLESSLELFVAEPWLARSVVVEPAVVGADARRRQWAMTARIGLLLESTREPEAPDLPANTALMALGAVTGLLFDEIQAARTGMLFERLPHLLFALLVPYLGPRQAAEEAWRKGSTASFPGRARAGARPAAARVPAAARRRR
jgi:AcrR family transcriptional regulator